MLSAPHRSLLGNGEGWEWDKLELFPILHIPLSLLSLADIPGLRAPQYIESLQREAQGALRELLHPEGQGRFSRILRVTSSLRSIPAALVTDLFFRPVIGDADMGELLVEMLLEVPGWPQAPWLPLPC